MVAIIFNEDKSSQYNLSIEKKIIPNVIQYCTFSLSTSLLFKFKINLYGRNCQKHTRNPEDRTRHLQRVRRKRQQATRTTKNKALSKMILGYN